MPLDENPPGAVYFVSDSGDRYRVYDTMFSGGKHTRVPLTDRRAKYRVFVPATGTRRVYLFKPGENRELAEELVAQQLRESEWSATRRFDPSKRTPW